MEYIIEENRIYAVEDGNEVDGGMPVAFVSFPQREGIFVINHTYVDERLRGQGIASELVRRAVEEIERRGGQYKATCSYAQLWLARNRGCEITNPLSCPIN